MNVNVLEKHNPWWRDGSVPDRRRGTVERDLLPGILRALRPERAVTVLGPRRVGKTVLLHQLVVGLLDSGVPAGRIVYLSADDRLLGEPSTLLPEVIDFVLGAAGQGGDDAERRLVYMLVDEVHAIPDWPLLVKRFIDAGDRVVWVLTSSAGAVLRSGTTESLAGRAVDFRLLPFSMAETALLSGGGGPSDILRRAGDVWRAHGVGPVEGERAEALTSLWRDSLGYSGDLETAARRYVHAGGFPEYLTETDETVRESYFWNNVVDRVLHMDVPAIAEVRNPQLMVTLVHRLLAAGPSLVNISDLSRELGATHITIREYLRVIEATMLDYVLDRYAGAVPRRHAGLKKSVPVDPGMVVALSRWDLAGPQAKAFEGRLAEVVVHTWLRRHRLGFDITHWRHRDKEVDFVASAPKWLMPIEVKWRDEGKTRALPGIEEFSRAYKTDSRLVVTRDTFDISDRSASIPLWMLG